MANDFGIDLGFNPYSSEMEDIQRRRMMAQMLRNNQMQMPINQTAGGYVIPVPKMAGLVNALNQGLGLYQDYQASEDVKNLRKKYNDDYTKTLEGAMGAMKGTPGTPDIPATEMGPPTEGGQWANQPAQAGTPAVAPNPGEAFRLLSQHPETRQMGQKGVLEQLTKAQQQAEFEPFRKTAESLLGEGDVDTKKLDRVAIQMTLSGNPQAVKVGEFLQKQSDTMKALQVKILDAKLAREDRAQAQKDLEQMRIDSRETIASEGRASRAQIAAEGRASRELIAGVVGRQNPAGAAAVNAEQGVTGVKRDKQGNVQLAPDVQKNLTKSAQDAQQAQQGLALVETLEGVVGTGQGSESGVGAAVAKAGSWLPGAVQPEITVANAKIEQARSALVGYLNDPRMKGNPSGDEGKRVLAVISDPTTPNSVKMQAIDGLKKTMKQQIKEHNDAYGKYDEQTRQRLDAVNAGRVEFNPTPQGTSRPALGTFVRP